MPKEMQGRRVAAVPGVHPAGLLTQAGDYCGPVRGYTGGSAAVYYLLPTARDADARGEGRSVRHVVGPPHVFTEEPDGSLTIRNSIGADSHWHGFLTAGRWELSPSKP